MIVGVAVAQVGAWTVMVNSLTAGGTSGSGSVAVTVKVKAPVVVGVPVMAPVVALRVRPGGSAPPVTAKVGLPVPPVVCRVVE
ncbi:hypothetical protein CG723_28880 [Streptomyces sp. CB01635]|nr:hypothetical protein CG723_28880 [Streptomyces sp. CB01635]